MAGNRDALYDFLTATTKAAASLQAAVEAAVEASGEPTCSCEQSTLTYDGPRVDCDVHGLPSAAFEAGRRQGAQEERDAAEHRRKSGAIIMPQSDLIEILRTAGYGISEDKSEAPEEGRSVTYRKDLQ